MDASWLNSTKTRTGTGIGRHLNGSVFYDGRILRNNLVAGTDLLYIEDKITGTRSMRKLFLLFYFCFSLKKKFSHDYEKDFFTP
jgi:hypothetical protein